MDRLCREYIELLSGDHDSSEKVWQLDKRIKEDKRKPGIQLQFNQTNFICDMIAPMNDGVITVGDLENFSDELRETVNAFLEKYSGNYLDI